MGITIYADAILKNGVLSSGVSGKTLRSNTRIQTDTGGMTVNSNWSQGLRQYELASVPRTIDQWRDIESLFQITKGGAFGFLLEDPKDHKVDIGQGKATLVSGAVYQLTKRYIFTGSSQYHDRNITRPKSTGLVVTYDGSNAPAYTLDSATGRVTFTGGAVADASLIAWIGEFYVPVHFTNDEIDWELVSPGAYEARYVAAPSIPISEVRE